MDFQLTDSDKKRFWSKVDIKGEDECWNWTRNPNRNYGAFVIGPSKKNKTYRANRISLLLSTKNVLNFLDPMMFACHTCLDNKKCVNPNHLYWGTPAENSTDMVNDGHSKPGELSNLSKLTEEQVRDIRRRYAEDQARPNRKRYDENNITLQKLADEFDMSKNGICDIIHRKKWKHI